MALRDLMKKELTKKELEILPTKFDVVGDILIFADFPSKLVKKEKVIGNKILENFPNVKVVCKKTKQYSGKFRTPKLKIIIGEKRTYTTYKENNVTVNLDVAKVYFSVRLSTERKRINQLVKKDEIVLVMFSGVGIYPINISKNTKAKEIYGVEINPTAHKYALENVKLNKMINIKLFKGDVNSILPKIRKKFDRILMPLPRGAEDYLNLAYSKIKKNGMIHFYDFSHENDFNLVTKKIKKGKIISLVKCGQYGTRKYRVCLDIKI